MTDLEKAARQALEWIKANGRYENAKVVATALSRALEQPAYRAVKTFHDGKPVYVAEQPAQQQCWKCGDMDAAFQAKCTVPACGMKEQAAQCKGDA